MSNGHVADLIKLAFSDADAQLAQAAELRDQARQIEKQAARQVAELLDQAERLEKSAGGRSELAELARQEKHRYTPEAAKSE